MSDKEWLVTRQTAGPLVRESRARMPRLSRFDDVIDRAEKNQLLHPAYTAGCSTRMDRICLHLALFGYDGMHYTITFGGGYVPGRYKDARRELSGLIRRLKNRNGGRPFDYLAVVEGRHGDHRYHFHIVLNRKEFTMEQVTDAWNGRGALESRPVLLDEHDSFQRLARYFSKEASDGNVIPVGGRTWTCSHALHAKLQKPKRFMSRTGTIRIPKNAAARQSYQPIMNSFGEYRYAWYMKPPDPY